MKTKYGLTTYWQDSINVLLGLGLFFSPWVLDFGAQETAARNAHVFGAILAVMAIAALFAYKIWEEWVSAVLGAWLFVSPWVLQFSEHSTAKFTHVLIGVAAIVLAIWSASQHDTGHMTAGR
jgi:hypothetical protein